MERAVGSTDPWVVPIVARLTVEYALETLVVTRDELRESPRRTPAATSLTGQLIVDDSAYSARTQRQVVSY
ncbi:hypothetical protein [Streptomyces sp. NPDC059247]|uniref:hypothetical protein n=1 Tax=Streptomyces sp. NPDC059247 TaxID=3346790 RepID=UPI0036C13E55